jgi:hypothetical protein
MNDWLLSSEIRGGVIVGEKIAGVIYEESHKHSAEHRICVQKVGVLYYSGCQNRYFHSLLNQLDTL